jgi:hypothetical protein
MMLLDAKGSGFVQLLVRQLLVMILFDAKDFCFVQLLVRQLVTLDECGLGSVLSWIGLFVMVDEKDFGPAQLSWLFCQSLVLMPFAVDASCLFLIP